MLHSLCESCGQRPSVVFITQVVDDFTTKYRFCELCARENALSEGWLSPFGNQWDCGPLSGDLMSGLLETEFPAPDEETFDADDFEAFTSLDSASSGVDLNQFLLPSHRVEPSPRCLNCQTPWDTLKSEGRAGCAACYAAFRDQLGDVINGVQRGETHLGKAPRAAQKRARRLEQLRKRRDNQLELLRNRLKAAVATEKYEDAAQLRDKIKVLGG